MGFIVFGVGEINYCERSPDLHIVAEVHLACPVNTKINEHIFFHLWWMQKGLRLNLENIVSIHPVAHWSKLCINISESGGDTIQRSLQIQPPTIIFFIKRHSKSFWHSTSDRPTFETGTLSFFIHHTFLRCYYHTAFIFRNLPSVYSFAPLFQSSWCLLFV